MFFFSKNNLPKIKDVVNLNDKNSKGTHWVSLFIHKNIVIYFDSFGIEYIPQDVLNKIRNKSITRSIFRVNGNESIMCGFYCIAFIEYQLQEELCQILQIYFLRMTIKRMAK